MRTVVIALFLSIPLAAAAQDRPDPHPPAPDTSYTFGDHAIDGGRYQPDLENILVRGGHGRESLVRPRVHFVPELLSSVETL